MEMLKKKWHNECVKGSMLKIARLPELLIKGNRNHSGQSFIASNTSQLAFSLRIRTFDLN
jgi:hypothetical protein